MLAVVGEAPAPEGILNPAVGEEAERSKIPPEPLEIVLPVKPKADPIPEMMVPLDG